MRDVESAVADLAHRPVNYDESQAPPHVTEGWHQDRWTVELGREAPGEPLPGGLVDTAGQLVNTYQFSDPRILRAAFRYPGDLVGRDMLLEGRFFVLRFLLGVRITAEIDELREGAHGPERVVGWAYQTLQGHLEQGKLAYEIAKELETGRVEFRIAAYSRRAQIRNPLLRVGFHYFGRWTQLRFYRHALRRLEIQMKAPPQPPQPGPTGLVQAPSGTRPGRFEWLTIRFRDPGR